MNSVFSKDEPGKLVKATLSALKERPRNLTFQRISDETGIEYGWVRVFSTGRINHPSANRIEILYEYLTGKSLNV